MGIDWNLLTTGGGSFTDNFQRGQANAIQIDEARRQQAVAIQNRQLQQEGRARVLNALARGRTLEGAALADAYGNHDMGEGLRAVSTAGHTQSQHGNTAFANTLNAIARVPYANRRAIIQAARATLIAEGADPQQIDAFDPTDDNVRALASLNYSHKDQVDDRISQQNADTAELTARHPVVDGVITNIDEDGNVTPMFGRPRAEVNEYGTVEQPGYGGNAAEGARVTDEAPAAGAAPGNPAHLTPRQAETASVLYNEFRSLGWTDEGARTMVAQIGRENGFDPRLMFGTHTDANPAAGTNGGIVSWNRDRRAAFMQFMTRGGFVRDGRIVPSREALRAQARFADQEMRARYPASAQAVRDPNGNYQTIEPVLSNNYFGWDRAGHRINAGQHLARMGSYYAATSALTGGGSPDPQVARASAPTPGASSLVDDRPGTYENRVRITRHAPRDHAPSGYRTLPDGSLEAIPGGPADQPSLDATSIDNEARQYILTGRLPALGQGRAGHADRVAILNRAAQILHVDGRDGASFAAGRARYRSGAAALQRQEASLTAISGAMDTVDQTAQSYLQSSRRLRAQTRSPIINAATQAILRQMGDGTLAEMDTAALTIATEYARVISSNTGVGGVLTDSARAEAIAILRGNYSVEQKEHAILQIRRDMAYRRNAMTHVIEQGYRNLESGAPVARSATTAPPGARQIGTYQGRPVYQLPNGRRVVGR
ncbi:MAG TPA: phage tail tip lysozyme [Allosphingosinicella sp.]|nr:phage tail tip lysozyme [Allosphingosinicella sp.]